MELIFQLTFECTLRCSYCYQAHKRPLTLDFNDAKLLLEDLILYINNNEGKIFKVLVSNREIWLNDLKNEKGLILNFFGGECALEFYNCKKIMKFWKEQCFKNNLEWLYDKTSFEFGTNGTVLTLEDYQYLYNEYKDKIIIDTSLDGCEKCQNTCRKTVGGQDSYEMVKKTIQNIKQVFGKNPRNKGTWTLETIPLIVDNIKDLISNGYTAIEGCLDLFKFLTPEESEFYYQCLIKGVDWILENDPSFRFPLIFETKFDNEFFQSDCGSNGGQLCISPGGILSPCHMTNSSFLGDQDYLAIYGNVQEGITNLELLQFFRSPVYIQPTTCDNCPISHGCPYCNAENLKYGGYLFRRIRNCGQVLAEARAQAYYIKRAKELGVTKYLQHFEEIESCNHYDENYPYLLYNPANEEDFNAILQSIFTPPQEILDSINKPEIKK